MLTLNIVICANLLLLFSILLFRKDNSPPNKLLAWILIIPGFNFFSNITILSGYFYAFPYFFFLVQCTAYLFAPFVYMYVNLFIDRKTKATDPLFFLTAAGILMAIYFAVDFVLLPRASQIAYLDGITGEPYPWQMSVTNFVFIILQQIFFTIAAIRVYQYKKAIVQNFSSFEKLRWQYISRFILIIWILNLTTITLYATLPMIQVEYIILPSVLTAIYFYILIYAFNQNSIFSKKDYATFVQDNKVIVSGRSAPVDNISGQGWDKTGSQLAAFLEEKKLYTNPDLSLYLLSKESGIPANRLSTIINGHFGKNFYDLINEKRVDRAKELLLEKGQAYTIESIAYESGFNSRASFYRSFKKHMGITPTEFTTQAFDKEQDSTAVAP